MLFRVWRRSRHNLRVRRGCEACFSFLGDFEVLADYGTVILFGSIVYNIIGCLSFKDLIRRFGTPKSARRDFYECGFRPQIQRPIRLSVQFLMICIFFLMYDVEFVFLFPFVADATKENLSVSSLALLFFIVFLIGIAIDYDRHALYWQYL